MTLDDGTIIPSYFSTQQAGYAAPSQQFDQLALRQGEIEEVIYPDDKRSFSKLHVEYRVAVQQKDSRGATTVVSWPGCRVASLFGGGADKLRYTLRARTKPPERDQVTSDGSKVLVMCINGTTARPYIVGGIPEDTVAESKDDGHCLTSEFNGASLNIDKDGQLKLNFRGATDNAGKLLDSAVADAENSSLFFDKDGGLKLSTHEDAQHFFIDHKNDLTHMLAGDWTVKANKKLSFDVGDQIDIKGQSGAKLEVSSQVVVRSSGVMVGNANESWMLGTTYRAAEQTLHSQMLSALGTLAGTLTAASASLTTAAAGLVASTVAAGAAPGVVAAATALGSAVSAVTTMASAISTFEGRAAQYISTRNFGD